MGHKINIYAQQKSLPEIKLHLGCGGDNFPGWINIDNYDFDPHDTSRSGSLYDVKMDIRELDVADGTVDAILLVHVVEHFVRWEMLKMLNQFYKKLRSGGQLIIETPDLDRCIEWYMRGRDAPHINTPLGPMNMGFTQFYGNQWSEIDFETHRYVWTQREMSKSLMDIGFQGVSISNEAKFHQKGRDMFVVAQK